MAHGQNAARQYGKEFWGRRPGNKHGGIMGKFAKKLTASRERQAYKMEDNSEC